MRQRLHGAVVHLALDGDNLLAATDLGGYLTFDLGIFRVPYCQLMRKVWEEVPIVWEAGLPKLRPPPTNHRCAR